MRCYPNNDCQMYIEDPNSDFPTVGIRHRPDLTKNYPKFIYSWRHGPQYEKWTKWDEGPYLPGTRLRKTSLPVAGQMPRYLINRSRPAGFGVPKAPAKFNLKEWLDWWRGGDKSKDDKKASKEAVKGKKGAKTKKKGKK